ncbi:MAG: RNA 2',3'-cyclic phosphodiesterase [Candidatus Omnitrophota bacterium]
MTRAFLALPFHAPFHQEIQEIQAHFRARLPGARYLPVFQVHLTLHFFGELSDARIQTAQELLREPVSTTPAFLLGLRGSGVFPDWERPSVLWIGLKGEIEKLVHFQKILEEKLLAGGFGIESRLFKPHLTIARFPRAGKNGKDPKIAEPSRALGVDSEIKKISLAVFYRSLLKPEGPQYEPIETYRFS